MSGVGRIMLFAPDPDGRMEEVPDKNLLAALLRETPLITQPSDGSRTFVVGLDGPEPRAARARGGGAGISACRDRGAARIGRTGAGRRTPLRAGAEGAAMLNRRALDSGRCRRQ
jgi:hypothetical protein